MAMLQATGIGKGLDVGHLGVAAATHREPTRQHDDARRDLIHRPSDLGRFRSEIGSSGEGCAA
jgi:hypothetical protein